MGLIKIFREAKKKGFPPFLTKNNKIHYWIKKFDILRKLIKLAFLGLSNFFYFYLYK
jgi:hypothetical protein